MRLFCVNAPIVPWLKNGKSKERRTRQWSPLAPWFGCLTQVALVLQVRLLWRTVTQNSRSIESNSRRTQAQRTHGNLVFASATQTEKEKGQGRERRGNR
jgi:cytochrome b561